VEQAQHTADHGWSPYHRLAEADLAGEQIDGGGDAAARYREAVSDAGRKHQQVARHERLAVDQEDFFPDPNSQAMSQVWWSDPKSFERAFSGVATAA
jgi:hypothetical protein